MKNTKVKGNIHHWPKRKKRTSTFVCERSVLNLLSNFNNKLIKGNIKKLKSKNNANNCLRNSVKRSTSTESHSDVELFTNRKTFTTQLWSYTTLNSL